MPQRDSLDKVYGIYVKGVATEPFTYKGQLLSPKPLRLSPMLVRGFTCPSGCGGCCPRFSLDYITPELVLTEARTVRINGRDVEFHSDLQTDHNNHHCRHLQKNGRCGIHLYNPFSCDFELIRFIEYKDPDRPTTLTQKLFGRGWNMLRVDEDRGALCSMTEPSPATVADVRRKMNLLATWCKHADIPHKVQGVIDWLNEGVFEPVVLP